MDRACSIKGEEKEWNQVIGGKATRKETTRKAKSQVGGCIKKDLRELGWSGLDWIHLAQDRDQLKALVNTVMNLQFP
jgi:hypothetical protein